MAKNNSDMSWWLLWLAFCLVALFLFPFLNDREEQRTIQACIQQGREPVVEAGALKECK